MRERFFLSDKRFERCFLFDFNRQFFAEPGKGVHPFPGGLVSFRRLFPCRRKGRLKDVVAEILDRPEVQLWGSRLINQKVNEKKLEEWYSKN